MSASALRKPLLAAAAIAVVVLLAVVGLALFNRGRPPDDATSLSTTPAHTVSPLPLPAPPAQGYVGSRACAQCHAEIASAYATHPMANSCAPAAAAPLIENYDDAQFTGPDRRVYRAERTPQGKILHHESLADEQGQLYEQTVDIAYVLGSGQHGRAYLCEKDGRLFQSPITWYSQQAKWDFSPGYDPTAHERFERRVDDGCLYCHVGRTDPLGEKDSVYADPAFTEASIGCERCHGPGEQHIAHWRAADSPSEGPDPIVNPARLSTAERDSVCFQCHLQGRLALPRFGRGFFDFRPGMQLADVLLVYVDGERTDGAASVLPVSQVEQMQASRCYQQSAGQMGCISCHDPHRAPAPNEKAAFYRDRCLACHQHDSCAATQAERQALPEPDSCIACHMPPLATQKVAHTSLTDHRVIRQPQKDQPAKPIANPLALALFGDEDRVPRRELDRGRGLLVLEAAQGMRSAPLAGKVRNFLIPPQLQGAPRDDTIAALANDPAALDGLALSAWLMSRPGEAFAFWRAALQADPHHRRALHYLAEAEKADGDLTQSLAYLDRLAADNPSISEVHARRAQLLAQLGKTSEAIAAAERSQELDPTALPLREFLAQLYANSGDDPQALKQRQMTERIRDALK